MPTKIVAYENFATGVVTSVPAEKLPDTAFQRAINTAFEPVVGGASVLRPRPGLRFAAEPAAGSGAYVAGMSEFVRFDDGARATHRIGVTSDGKLWDLNDVSSTEIVLPTAAGEFSVGGLDGTRWQFQQAANRLYAVSGAGDNDAFKVYKKDGVNTLYAAPFGINAPGAAPTQGTTVAGDMTGTYQLLTTAYNEDTDTESSPSAILTVTLASNQVTFNRNFTPDAQATHWRIYILKEGVDSFHWRDAAMQVAVGTSSITLNLTDDDLTDLFIRAPLPHVNDPLPEGVVSLAWHQSRMFAATGDKIYYSNVGNPEQFDPQEPVGRWEIANPNDGQLIVAIKVLNETMLAIIKERSAYVLVGDDPSNWTVENVTESLGAYGRYVVEGDGMIAFWSGEGPAIWTGSGKPQLIANEIIRQYVRQGVLNLASLTADYPIAFDPVEHRFLFGVPLTGAAAHLTVLSWSTVHQAWETSGWDLPTVKSFATMLSTSGEHRVFLSTNEKLVYEIAPRVKTDAAANETGVDLVHTATAVTASTITFNHVGTLPVNPKGSRITVIDPETARVHRSVVTSITGSVTRVVALATPFVVEPRAGAIIVLDAPVLEWDSRVGPKQFLKKRFHRAFMDIATNGDTPVLYAFFKDQATTPARVFQPTLAANITDEFGTTPPTISGAEPNFKGRLGTSGFSWFIRLIGWYPRSNWAISRVAAEVEDRSYAR